VENCCRWYTSSFETLTPTGQCHFLFFVGGHRIPREY
jgi:hypothetical protein